jgi:hypothetical protein
MSLEEIVDTTRVYRVAGLTGDRTALVTSRPIRVPHHTISDAGLIGRGPMPLPGPVVGHGALVCRTAEARWRSGASMHHQQHAAATPALSTYWVGSKTSSTLPVLTPTLRLRLPTWGLKMASK